jgi:hypothetical protein
MVDQLPTQQLAEFLRVKHGVVDRVFESKGGLTHMLVKPARIETHCYRAVETIPVSPQLLSDLVSIQAFKHNIVPKSRCKTVYQFRLKQLEVAAYLQVVTRGAGLDHSGCRVTFC